MFKFPQGLYCDVRIEKLFQTNITITLSKLDEFKEKQYHAAFIRIYDGKRWYYSSISDIDNIQAEIDKLASLATPDGNIDSNPIVKKFEVNKGTFIEFDKEKDVSKINKKEKLKLLESYYPIISNSEYVTLFKAMYLDQKVVKNFYSSKGSDITFDFQRVGFRIYYELKDGDKKFDDRFDLGSNYYNDLLNLEDDIKKKFEKSISFLKNAKPVKPGKYPVILSPEAAGVFAHESFGHKSEADFMIGDEQMKKQWAIGTKVGSDILSIVDSGLEKGVGYVPFDDEGTKAKKTYLIKNGILSGRLHSTTTAALLNEDLTGNARSLNFEFEPIVRMTTTYILPGDKKLDELISEVKEGIFVETIKHGSGMSTFTLAPSISYMIRDGKIAEPVNISVISGNVFETLNLIDGVSDELTLLSFSMGGCGKMEQAPLPVGFGGPYVRVKELDVR